MKNNLHITMSNCGIEFGEIVCTKDRKLLSGWQAGQLNYQYAFNLLTDVGEALILAQI